MSGKSLLKTVDAYLSSFLPLVVVAYFCYRHSYFAGQMFVVGWLSFVINMTFTLETFKETFTVRSSITSLFNLLFFGYLAFQGIISWDNFLIGFILGDCVALIFSIIYFFLFRKGLNGDTAWRTFGATGTLALIVLFSATVYPYIGQWIIFLMSHEITLLGALMSVVTFGANISRKSRMITSRMDSRKNDPNYDQAEEISKAMTGKLTPEARSIIIGLGLWFFGVGIVYAIYVHNA